MISELMERDHRQLSALLNELLVALDEQSPAATFALLDLFWARLAVHIRAENLCLFPALVGAFPGVDNATLPPFDEVNAAIETLRSDHNFFMAQLSTAVNIMRDAQSRPEGPQNVVNACEDVRGIVAAVSERLSQHDRLEEEKVYKWTDTILSAEAGLLVRALKRELDNMPPRFTSANSSTL